MSKTFHGEFSSCDVAHVTREQPRGWGAELARRVPVSESFCSPLAPTVKGSFRLVARSLTSFVPSLRSSFGVLVRETLSLS